MFTLALAAAVAGPLGSARADVVAIGDVTPAKANPDEDPLDPDDDFIPDLPQFGNDFANPPVPPIPLIIVGGTGQNIGGTATGQLTIDIPTDTAPLEAIDSTIGGNIFGLGLARVVSLNSEWRVTNQMTVGEEGQGFLEIQAGARVTTDLDVSNTQNPGDDAERYDFLMAEFEGAQGFALLDGFASLLLTTNASIGHWGQGRIDMLNRARMVTRSDASIGTDIRPTDNAFGNGYVLVDGQGTRWTVGIVASSQSPTPADNFNGVLYVGREGHGTLEIANQGWVTIETDVHLGFAANPANQSRARGEVTVTGQDSQIWALEEIFVGNAAGTSEGELTIADRGLARADDGVSVGQLGYVEFQGGTLLTPNVLNNGVMRGYGRIDAAVQNNGDIRNAAALADERELLTFSRAVENTPGSIIESIGGEMEFEAVVSNSGQIFAKDAILRFRGGLVGSGDLYTQNSVIETQLGIPLTAALTVGAGVTNIIGDINLTGMEAELGHDFSQLFVTGDATLSGQLSITLSDGFTPVTGQSFEILRSGDLNGVFSSEVLFGNPGLLWDVQYTSTSVFVTFGAAAPPGMGADFNGDGIVDIQDLAIWQANFGLGTNPPPAATQADGDANGDGVVDGADFMIIQRRFGGPPAVPAAT
ncbi:hypothetical protein DCC79_08135, partial [bacterium]